MYPETFYAFSECTSLADITFEGAVPPAIDSYAFNTVTATAYYPGGAAWTEDVRQNYGGILTWIESSANSGIPGDADGNGAVNILDVMTIINIITSQLEPTDSQRKAADLTGDGAVNIFDAMMLINRITGG